MTVRQFHVICVGAPRGVAGKGEEGVRDVLLLSGVAVAFPQLLYAHTYRV